MNHQEEPDDGLEASAGYGPKEAAFAPPRLPDAQSLAWQRLSPRFRTQRRITALFWLVPVAGLGAALLGRTAGAVGAALWLAAAVVSYGLVWIVAELAYRCWGYAERPEDLVVVQGVFVKRLTVVPYRRMEFVEVTAGPVDQWLGLATVRLHTAAATTDAKIPGLPAPEAARLRDRLAGRDSATPDPR